MKNKQLRKEQLHDRAQRYGNTRSNFTDPAQCWQDGYRSALKDVRRAAGKSGVPTALVKLLRPMK